MNPMFSSRTYSEQMRYYSEMVKHANGQLHMNVVPLRTVTPTSLLKACEELHARIETFMQGIDTADEPRMSPGLRRLRNHPDAETIRQATLADNARAVARIQEEKRAMTETNGAAPAADAPAKKKRAAKTAKPAKKAAAKKAVKGKVAKKAKAAKKPAKAKTERAASTDDALKLVEISKDNPCREGTEAHKRFEFFRKFKGKTRGAIKEAGGHMDALRRHAAAGHVKLA